METLTAAVRAKAGWTSKIRRPEIVRKWVDEAVAQGIDAATAREAIAALICEADVSLHLPTNTTEREMAKAAWWARRPPALDMDELAAAAAAARSVVPRKMVAALVEKFKDVLIPEREPTNKFWTDGDDVEAPEFSLGFENYGEDIDDEEDEDYVEDGDEQDGHEDDENEADVSVTTGLWLDLRILTTIAFLWKTTYDDEEEYEEDEEEEEDEDDGEEEVSKIYSLSYPLRPA
ncbi:hypothetical protein HK405_011982 [Cladochytrium tenue]|nr:hypothetical protein HK405_011982 [Cladochytrium tenue]